MARQRSQTVDYFPHVCSHIGPTMPIIEQRFGNDGYSFWFKLLERLGCSKGHFIDTGNNIDWEFLKSYTRFDDKKCRDILDLLAKLKAIDPDLWSVGVIWSQNFVDGVKDAYRKRTSEIPIKPDFRRWKPEQEGVLVVRNTQSKVKEIKVKEREDTRSDFSKQEIHPSEEYHPETEQLNIQAEHAWNTFESIMPKRNGIFADRDECRSYWARKPAQWSDWIAAVKNYRDSKEVADGAICHPMKFLTKKYLEFLGVYDGGKPLGVSVNALPDRAWKKELQESELTESDHKASMAMLEKIRTEGFLHASRN